MPTDAPQPVTETTRLTLLSTAGGGCRVSGGGGLFRAVQQRVTADSARVALVPDRALLLAGDDVALDVEVGPGLHLELIETGGTVAYDMRGGHARWEVRFALAAGASLVHRTLPWICATGSDVVRSTVVELGVAARAVMRETLVLGRHGEAPGALTSHMLVRRAGADVLVEELNADDLTPYRVLDQVMALGGHPFNLPESLEPSGTTRLDLASGDVLWRRLDDMAHAAANGLDRLFAALAQ